MATGKVQTSVKQGFFRVSTTADTNVEVTADSISGGSLPTVPQRCAYTIAGASNLNSNAAIIVDGSRIFIHDSSTNANRLVRWFQFD